jgi:hypothetical protein
MRKIILESIAVLAIVGLAVINIGLSSYSQSGNILSNLTLANTEALAGEWGGWENFFQGQGFYKDEREIKERCPKEQSSSGSGSASYGGASASGNGSSSQSNPSNRTDIRCGYGNENCTPVKC